MFIMILLGVIYVSLINTHHTLFPYHFNILYYLILLHIYFFSFPMEVIKDFCTNHVHYKSFLFNLIF